MVPQKLQLPFNQKLELTGCFLHSSGLAATHTIYLDLQNKAAKSSSNPLKVVFSQ